MKFLQIVKTIFVLFVLSVLVSCSSTDGASSSANSGRVSLLITDGPTNDFDQINITLESISFLSEDNGDDNNSHEVILFEERRIINLLALQNYSDLLATTIIPVGTYNKIRLHVSQVELVKLNPDGTVLSSDIAKLPANGKIDLNPQRIFEVIGDGHLVIELDMDANKSIHIVKTGKGYNFRPVIFVNILGAEELKLVILDGKVLARSESGFQLCEVEALQVNDSCLAVLISANTVVQNDQIDLVDPGVLKNNDFVTVLGKASSEAVNALHIVIAADTKEVQNQALFTGKATSPVAVDDSFGMKTDGDNNVVAPGTMLTVTLAASARVFDKFGNEVASDNIKTGSDLDVFGLAKPDLTTVTDVKAAFTIVNNDVMDDEISGVIVDIIGSVITVEIDNGSSTTFECIDVTAADMFLLNIVGGNINSDEISINNLNIGMSVDVYGQNKYPDCMSANVVLASGN